MKVKLSLAAIVVVGFIVLGACNTTSSVGSTSSPAYNSGQLFGSSLLSLYSDYKTGGENRYVEYRHYVAGGSVGDILLGD